MKTAPILVDIQNDFVPGGALAVPDGDAVVPVAKKTPRPMGATFATACSCTCTAGLQIRPTDTRYLRCQVLSSQGAREVTTPEPRRGRISPLTTS